MAPDPSAPIPPSGPEPVRSARYEILSAGEPIRRARRNFGLFAGAIFGLMLSVGVLVGLVAQRLALGVAIFGIAGSALLWFWLPGALERPLAALAVGPAGLEVRDAGGAVRMYAWRDPTLRLVLDHPLETVGFPYRSSRTLWTLHLRPPRRIGIVPEGCYDDLTNAAREAGLAVTNRQYWHKDRLGGWWVVETAIGPRRSSP